MANKTLDQKIEEHEAKLLVDEAWKHGLKNWNSPSIPFVIAPQTEKERTSLGEVGQALAGEFAFMKYPEFQTYVNLERIAQAFSSNPQRGLQAITTHEVGHRFCPYDIVTTIILNHRIEKALRGEQLPYDAKTASKNILNLFTDTCINTLSVRKGDNDIPWAYQELSKDKAKSKLWRVYGKSMELAWKKPILPQDTKLSDEEMQGAQGLAGLFERDYFDRARWEENCPRYAQIISKFLEDKQKDGQTVLGDIASGNIPKQMNKKTAQEIAKRLARIGSNGLPTNGEGLKEFKEIMAGFEQGDPVMASIEFYDMLSDSYNVMFATQPFGRPRVNPFQPIKWTPSMGVDRLDVDYSAQVGGRIIPAVNTYAWKTRKRETRGGLEEVIPNVDIYLDTSESMLNPLEQISLPVLSGFVVAKKAHRKGASVRATTFSGKKQYETQETTRDLRSVFEKLVKYFGGGTIFPTNVLLECTQDPRQALIITDTFIANAKETGEAVSEFIKRNKGNRVTVYAMHDTPDASYLRNAGAEVIIDTSTNIFKRTIGKADEVYLQ